ncbi:MAG TPA: alkane 1-monooxygenase, partial [Corynebacterium nuruki]|nr:alkane 1-monooxygenase [Corynebacterium nuruki]
ELPAGYATMIFAAALPPVWFWIMDRRLMQFYNYDIERANLHPAKAAKLRKKWNRIAAQQPAAVTAGQES